MVGVSIRKWTKRYGCKITVNDPTPPPLIIEKKIGRNESCHCNSGKKFKRCCA